MNSVFRNPLFQFVLIGVILFGIQQLTSRSNEQVIEINKEVVGHIKAELIALGIDSPSNEVIENAIQQKIEQELLYHFALANELEVNNDLVKEALAETANQFIYSDAKLNDPGDEILETFLQNSPNEYTKLATLSFRQYFFGEDIMFAQKMLFDSKSTTIEGSESPALNEVQHLRTYTKISKDFGQLFLDSLLNCTAGWRGIIQSKHGIHVVVVDEVIPARLAKLNEVRVEALKNYRQQILLSYRDSVLEVMKNEVKVIRNY